MQFKYSLMYAFIPPKDCLQCHMYVYLIFQSTKDMIWKTKSIAKSCIEDSQESFEIPNAYMGLRDNRVITTDLEEAIKGCNHINKELLRVSDIMST